MKAERKASKDERGKSYAKAKGERRGKARAQGKGKGSNNKAPLPKATVVERSAWQERAICRPLMVTIA